MNVSGLNKLDIASISDIHLGHPDNPAVRIIQNLKRAFSNAADLAELDIIFIAGDVFDRLLSLPDDAVHEIDFWITHLLRLCKKHDIILRVLEGTPSHDWKQSKRFVKINELSRIGADVKHVTELSVEYIERHGINVLYVPDELPGGPNKTFESVISLLEEKGLQKVDYAIMHGQFAYQAVGNEQHLNHIEDNYLSIVKEYIFVGHIHTFSTYDRIIAQGSFDRLRQGQEEAKGYVRATIRPGFRSAKFIENVGAMRFVTIDCSDMDVDEALEHIRERVADLPAGSFVRVKANESHPVFANMPLLVQEHTLYRWSKKQVSEDDADGQEQFLDLKNAEYNPIIITADSVTELVADRIRSSGFEEDFVCRCAQLINDYK